MYSARQKYLRMCLKSSCRYISGLKCIRKRSRNPHADTSVVRNVSANASEILMQIHQWSEMYLQTLQESSCRYISGLKCICERSRNPHADTAEVKCRKKWISASFRRTFKAAKRKLPLYENSFIKATAPISFLFILYYFIASIVLIHTSISPFPRLFQQQ